MPDNYSKTMNISKEDYARLEKLINDTLEKNPTAKAAYIAKGLTRTRFVWDTWHVTVDRSQLVNAMDKKRIN